MMLYDGAEWESGRCCGRWRLSSYFVNGDDEANERQQTRAPPPCLSHSDGAKRGEGPKRGSLALAASLLSLAMNLEGNELIDRSLGRGGRKTWDMHNPRIICFPTRPISLQALPESEGGRAVTDGSIQNIQELDWKSKTMSVFLDRDLVSKYPRSRGT